MSENDVCVLEHYFPSDCSLRAMSCHYNKKNSAENNLLFFIFRQVPNKKTEKNCKKTEIKCQLKRAKNNNSNNNISDGVESPRFQTLDLAA